MIAKCLSVRRAAFFTTTATALKPIGEAVQQHRGEIEAAATCTASACADTTCTIKALRQVEAKLDSNRDIAKQKIIAGFRRVSQASLSESNAFCKRVDEVHKEKTDAVKAQIFALEAAETRSEEAVALARSTLQGATAEQVLQMKKAVGGWACASQRSWVGDGAVPCSND